MTDAVGFKLVGSLGALVLVGSAILTHRRQGWPVMRYALIWAAIFFGASVIALALGHRIPAL